jgi:uncharacterized protein (TIGR03083 family)
MARLDYPDYLRHLRGESRRFRDVLAGCASDARVPGCPEWTAGDLLWHLAEVQWFWGTIIRTRPLGPDAAAEEPERPKSYDGLLEAFDTYSAALIGALEEADPAEQAWSWSTEQTVGFTFRRQAHEALIHRLDAEQTADHGTPLDPVLAADGVDECLDVMYGGAPPWGQFAPLPHFVQVELSDRDESVWVQIGRFTGTDPSDQVEYDDDDIRVVPDPGTAPDVVVHGPAASLDAWLWRRGDDRDLRISGDRNVYDHFRKAVEHPIN